MMECTLSCFLAFVRIGLCMYGYLFSVYIRQTSNNFRGNFPDHYSARRRNFDDCQPSPQKRLLPSMQLPFWVTMLGFIRISSIRSPFLKSSLCRLMLSVHGSISEPLRTEQARFASTAPTQNFPSQPKSYRYFLQGQSHMHNLPD